MPYRYEEIAEELRTRITARQLLPGQQLPAESQLASEYGVGMPTIRHALELLRDSGMVDKYHGVGTFVRARPPRITYAGGWRGSTVRLPEISLRIRVLCAEVSATKYLASLLHVPERTALTEFAYHSSHDGTPYSLAYVYVPRAVVTLPPPVGNCSPWGDDIRLRILKSGLQLARTEERVTARKPTPEEASRLRLPPSASVLVIQRRSSDKDGRVLEGAHLVIPGDRTEAMFTTQAPRDTREKAHHG